MVLSRHRGVGMALLHRIDRDPHRGRARAADRLAWLLARVNRIGGVDDLHARAEQRVMREFLADQGFVTVEVELERLVAALGASRTGDHHRSAVVPTHCVDGDSRACVHALKRPGRSRAQASVETISRPL
jgi:hypothetical protein